MPDRPVFPPPAARWNPTDLERILPKNVMRVAMSKKTTNSDNIPSFLAGVAGEYFVAAELSRRGYIASISLRNTRGIDILATNQTASRSVTIQCKTSQRGTNRWVLTEKSEDFHAENHYYVFVALGRAGERPSFHVLPSADVAKAIRESNEQWLRTPGRGGRPHVANPVRNFILSDNRCLDRWDLLRL